MTIRETERLARVEQQMIDVKEDVKDLKKSQAKGFDDLNKKLDAFITASDDKFLTVAQAKLISWIIGFLLTLTAIGIALLNYFKTH